MSAPAPRILRRREVDLRPGERLVQPRAVGTLVLALTCFALAGLVAWRYRAGALHGGWAVVLGSICALLGGGFLQGWRLSLRADAWLLAVGPERVLVSLRSHLRDRRGDDDPQILELPVAHVESVRRTRVRRARSARTNSGVDYSYSTWLDFRTRGLDLGPLREVLAAEAAHRPHGSAAGREHARVEGETLHVKLGSTRPAGDAVLYLLGEYVVLEPDVSEEVDRTGRRTRKVRGRQSSAGT